METTTNELVTSTSVGLRFGLFLGLIWVIVDFLLRQIGLGFLSYGSVTLAASILVSVTIIILAHRAFKKGNANLMSYSKGVVITLLIMIIWSAFSAIFNYLYVHYIDPEFVDKMQASMVEFMERNRVPEDQIAKSTVRFEEMKSGFGKAFISSLSTGLTIGVILGLIISIFTKRNHPEFE
ncbi:hypothetical protein GCM10027422_28370 [Hymenobacter arcticus]